MNVLLLWMLICVFVNIYRTSQLVIGNSHKYVFYVATSSPFLSALWEYCVSHEDVVGICCNSHLFLDVAMLPFTETPAVVLLSCTESPLFMWQAPGHL